MICTCLPLESPNPVSFLVKISTKPLGEQYLKLTLGVASLIFLHAGSIQILPNQTQWASQVALVVKNPSANAGGVREAGSIPGSGRSLERTWQPTPIFLSGESHGQRSLVGYSPQGCKKLDTTEVTQHIYMQLILAYYIL